MSFTVSIIICTCNRAKDLEGTLEALGRLVIPSTMPAELIVVDNGSTDRTADLVKGCRLPNMPVRYISETRCGKSHGLNTGLAAAQGKIALFTDDDVRPPQDWIPAMCGPILAGQADAVCGGVKTAPHLIRSWMKPAHRGWLVSSEFTNPAEVTDPYLIGANMAFIKDALTRVPGFDPALGPGGTLGAKGGEDTLFSLQFKKAGYKIIAALHVAVEHHFDEARMTKSSFLTLARSEGLAGAYLTHHWQHHDIRYPHLRLIKNVCFLTALRLLRASESRVQEGCPEWEMALVQEVWFYRQYLIERKRPRLFEKQGLVKLSRMPRPVPASEQTIQVTA